MRTSLLFAAVFFLSYNIPVAAQAPIQVGSVEPISIKSETLAGAGAFATRHGWELTIHHPGATYIALHFAKFDLPAGESVTVSDGVGLQAYTLSGRGKRNAGLFWARHVKGDTAILQFSTHRPFATGFEIDRYAAGNVAFGGDSTTSSFGDVGTEAICGTDDKENAICYADSHPTEYDRSRPVARLLIQGSLLCTGWLASAENHLITNEHCITSSSDATNTDYEFMAETDQCADSSCMLCDQGTIFSGAAFVQDNADLDYALVQIDSGDPAATYGYLAIDDRDAVTGERIYIPQHPKGGAKELAIESSDGSDPGWCEVDGFTTGCTSSNYLDVAYQCDTEPGSSGSPVIAQSSHKVIGLHHCADCPNRAVPINLIYDEIGPLVDPEACTLEVDDLVLENDTVSGSETQEACKTVSAGNNYFVNTGGDLTLRTRDHVILRDGTAVAAGGGLHIAIDPTTGSQ